MRLNRGSFKEKSVSVQIGGEGIEGGIVRLYWAQVGAIKED